MSALAHPRARLVAAAALLLAVAATALGGDWVYDDLYMVGSPAMDDPSDVPATFVRTSADYLAAAPSGGTATHTYRPLAMLTLVATHVVRPSPLAHHLAGWALHALAVALLLAWDRRRASAWTLAVALFALHPALAEAWLYVNGRADLVAGLCLVVLWRTTRSRARSAWIATALAALAGALAKETFLCAAPFVLLAAAAGGSRTARAPRARAHLAAGVAGLASAIALVALLRAAHVIGAEAGAAGSIARLLSPRIASRWPALIGLASETLALPFPRPMRSLAHELGPASLAHLPALLVPIALVVALVRARRARAALHVAGAIAVLLPTALVSEVFWLGFDRYLYMPAVLLVTACAPELRATSPDRRVTLAGVALAALLGALTAASGLAYASHAALADAILARRPEDPAGYLLVAAIRARDGDPEGALELVSAVPADALTPASAHQAASLLHRLRRPDLVAIVLEEAHRRDPDDPYLLFDLLGLRASQGRFDDALELAADLRARPGFCPAVRAQLAPWSSAPQIPERARARAAELARPCE